MSQSFQVSRQNKLLLKWSKKLHHRTLKDLLPTWFIHSETTMQLNFVLLIYLLFTIVHLDSVHLQSGPALFSPIPDNVPNSINIDTSKAIKLDLPPVTIQGMVNEVSEMINTGKLVAAVFIKNSQDHVTGGVFGSDVYVHINAEFYWTKNGKGRAFISIDGVGYPLYYLVSYRNLKYPTDEVATKFRDGFAAVIFPLGICTKQNLEFISLEEKLNFIRRPKSSVPLPVGDLIKGVDFADSSTPYYAFAGTHTDPITGQQSPSATVVVVKQDPSKACITRKQFESSFGRLKNLSGGKLFNKESQQPANRTIVQSIGVSVNKVFL